MTLDEFELELHFKDRHSQSYRAVFLGWRANDVSLTPLSDSRFSPQPDLLLQHAGFWLNSLSRPEPSAESNSY